MKQGWEYTTFADVMKPAKSERCGSRTDLPILSITMRQGIILQSERFKKVIASVDTKDYKIIKNGQLVIAFPIDEGLIYTQDVAEEGIMSPAYNVWDVDYSRFNRRFLNIYLHCPWAMNYYKSKLRGTTLRRRMIPKEDLLSLPIPVPPLPEQEKIVSELDCLSGIIEKKRQQLKELDALAQSIFYEMFGNPVDNERGWEVKAWDQVFETKTGKLNANAMVENGKYPFFTCSKDVYRIDDYAFDCEALLLAGNNATANYDVKYYKGKFNAYQRTYILTLKNNSLYSFFKVSLENKLSLLQEQSIGVMTKYLTMGILNKISFLIPPLPLQQSFAQKIEAIEQQKALIKQSIAEVETLFNARMQEYFE